MLFSLNEGKLKAQINDGQLVSLSKDNSEFLHGGGKPEELKNDRDKIGWPNSEILMFPVIGNVQNYLVYIGEEDFLQDEDGISKLLPFKTKDRGSNWVSFFQNHQGRYHFIANKDLANKTEPPKELEWPYAFQIDKEFKLENDCLNVSFSLKNLSNEVMPYMFGWRPAFKTHSGWKFEANERKISLDEVLEASKDGAGAIGLEGAKKITYGKASEGFELKTEGFRDLMLWSPDISMFCIEPLTVLPLNGGDGYFKKGKVDLINPFSKRDYSVSIKIL